jgi:hypothetical protein
MYAGVFVILILQGEQTMANDYIEAAEGIHKTYEKLIATQKELIEVYKQEAEEAAKEIEQQRVTIQELQDKLAGATL